MKATLWHQRVVAVLSFTEATSLQTFWCTMFYSQMLFKKITIFSFCTLKSMLPWFLSVGARAADSCSGCKRHRQTPTNSSSRNCLLPAAAIWRRSVVSVTRQVSLIAVKAARLTINWCICGLIVGLQDYEAALKIDPHNQALQADTQSIRDVIQTSSARQLHWLTL